MSLSVLLLANFAHRLRLGACILGVVATVTSCHDDRGARRAAERVASRDAKDTASVVDVRDGTSVTSTAPTTSTTPTRDASDAALSRDIDARLSGDPRVKDANSLRVSVAGARVRVEGVVATSLESLAVVGDIESVPGTRGVQDRLVVRSDVRNIEKAIQDELHWDPVLGGDHVEVRMADDGTATLTGAVGSWSELRAAASDAIAGGAAHVIDLIKRRGPPAPAEP
jgi:osmotically-inducible protein OsmY